MQLTSNCHWQHGYKAAACNYYIHFVISFFSYIEQPQVTGLHITTDNLTIIGDNIDIQCYVTGVPEPDVLWTRDGAVLSSNPDITIMTQAALPNNAVLSILSIISADISDDGKYTCIGTSHVGNSSLTIELTLSGKQRKKNSKRNMRNVFS